MGSLARGEGLPSPASKNWSICIFTFVDLHFHMFALRICICRIQFSHFCTCRFAFSHCAFALIVDFNFHIYAFVDLHFHIFALRICICGIQC